MKREASFGNKFFRPYVRAHPPSISCPVETKQTTSNSISFDCVAEHQLDALLACKSERGFLYKISDESRGHKPFDFIFFRNSPAYVVIKYPKTFEIIDVEVFIKEKLQSKKRSLTSDRAKEISVISVKI